MQEHEYTVSVKSGDMEEVIEVEKTSVEEDINGIIVGLLDEGYTIDEIKVNDQRLYFHQDTGNFQVEPTARTGAEPEWKDCQATPAEWLA